MSYTFQNRKVEVTEMDFELGEGAYAISAHWEDTEKDLTDDELETFNKDCAMELYDEGHQMQVMKAEAAADLAEDR